MRYIKIGSGAGNKSYQHLRSLDLAKPSLRQWSTVHATTSSFLPTIAKRGVVTDAKQLSIAQKMLHEKLLKRGGASEFQDEDMCYFASAENLFTDKMRSALTPKKFGFPVPFTRPRPKDVSGKNPWNPEHFKKMMEQHGPLQVTGTGLAGKGSVYEGSGHHSLLALGMMPGMEGHVLLHDPDPTIVHNTPEFRNHPMFKDLIARMGGKPFSAAGIKDPKELQKLNAHAAMLRIENLHTLLAGAGTHEGTDALRAVDPKHRIMAEALSGEQGKKSGKV